MDPEGKIFPIEIGFSAEKTKRVPVGMNIGKGGIEKMGETPILDNIRPYVILIRLFKGVLPFNMGYSVPAGVRAGISGCSVHTPIHALCYFR